MMFSLLLLLRGMWAGSGGAASPTLVVVAVNLFGWALLLTLVPRYDIRFLQDVRTEDVYLGSVFSWRVVRDLLSHSAAWSGPA